MIANTHMRSTSKLGRRPVQRCGTVFTGMVMDTIRDVRSLTLFLRLAATLAVCLVLAASGAAAPAAASPGAPGPFAVTSASAVLAAGPDPAAPVPVGGLLARLAIAQTKLTAAGGAMSDQFGSAVAIWGNTAVVGVPYDNIGAKADQGSAYVFTRSGTAWTHQTTLTASDGAAGDVFGYSVAISGDTIVVGAVTDTVGTTSKQGSVYVFTWSGTAWTQQTRLTARGGAAEDLLGYSVALSGDTVVAGAAGANIGQGSAYVFTRSGTQWTQQDKLSASDGDELDNFGNSVAIWGDTAVVGAPRDDIGDNANQGSAYVFTRNGTVWFPQAKLTVSAGANAARFGSSVALSGGTAVVGAPTRGHEVGEAYVYVRSGTTWSRQARLGDPHPAAYDNFGRAVAISGGTAVVGVHQDLVGTDARQGSAFVFMRSGRTWTRRARLTAAGGDAGDYFGVSVGISGSTAVAGALSSDVGANFDQGAAYIFSGLVAPKIRSLTPTRGRARTTVTITGTGFGAKRGTSKVYFGSKAVTRYAYWSSTKIKANVPRLTKGRKTVRVRTSLGRSNGKFFRRY